MPFHNRSRRVQCITSRSPCYKIPGNEFRGASRFLPFSMRSRVPKWPWLVRLYLRLPFKPMAGQMLLVARTPA